MDSFNINQYPEGSRPFWFSMVIHRAFQVCKTGEEAERWEADAKAWVEEDEYAVGFVLNGLYDTDQLL
jgi:hypothetical protein